MKMRKMMKKKRKVLGETTTRRMLEEERRFNHRRGDLNARVGKDKVKWKEGVIGANGEDKINTNGERL